MRGSQIEPEAPLPWTRLAELALVAEVAPWLALVQGSGCHRADLAIHVLSARAAKRL